MQYKIECTECDSEYTINTEHGLISDEPQFCSICGSPTEAIDITDQ